MRPDGGYKLVIEDIKPDGSLKASYYNPKKINVSVSKWTIEEDRPQLFVELRDPNYPGSTYTLVYSVEEEALEGNYFLAAQRQTLEIKFVKMPQAQ